MLIKGFGLYYKDGDTKELISFSVVAK